MNADEPKGHLELQDPKARGDIKRNNEYIRTGRTVGLTSLLPNRRSRRNTEDLQEASQRLTPLSVVEPTTRLDRRPMRLSNWLKRFSKSYVDHALWLPKDDPLGADE
jgi:hypothetical protein